MDAIDLSKHIYGNENMNNIYLKTLISISVLGAFYSGFGYLSMSNYLWAVSNPLLAQYNFKHSNRDQGYFL